MKAGDEVPVGRKSYDDYMQMRLWLSMPQLEWLAEKGKQEQMMSQDVVQEHGVPSDAELQRREKA